MADNVDPFTDSLDSDEKVTESLDSDEKGNGKFDNVAANCDYVT